MRDLILLKIGGSLITNKGKPFSVRLNTIKRISQEIYSVSSKTDNHIVIGHGGGSFPHVPAKKYRTHEGVISKKSIRGIAEVQDAAARLNRIVVSELIKAKLNVISFPPSSFMISKNGEVVKSFLNSIKKSLELNLIPVVYGDVVLDLDKGCSILSTEKVLNFIALKFKKEYRKVRIIYCGITDGVYDSEGNTIKVITSKNYKEIESELGLSCGIDVTGGMLHKVKEALKIAQEGIQTIIINGNRKQELMNSIFKADFKGTLIK